MPICGLIESFNKIKEEGLSPWSADESMGAWRGIVVKLGIHQSVSIMLQKSQGNQRKLEQNVILLLVGSIKLCSS